MAKAIFLFFILLFAVKVASQSCGTKTVGESSPASFQDNLDTAARNPGVGYLANQYTFDCCGVITSWNAVIGALGTVKFQIWRPSGANYELVGQNEYTFSTADQLIEQTLSVPNADIPTVLPNDVLGWYSANNDMIPYSSVAGTGAIQQTMAAPSLGSSVSWTPGATLSGRTYALGALTGVNSIPSFTNLDQTLTYLDKDTPPTTLLTLTTTDADPQDTVLTVAMTTTSTEFQLSTDQVQPQTGQWTVGTYPLSFTVTDQCGNEGTGTLTVEITNTAPDMTAMVTADSIREDVTTQTHMTDLTVTDEQSYTCTYTGSAPFNVQPKVTGSTTYALFVNGEAGLNYNTQNQYTLPITCTDDLGLSTTKDIVVSITENPPPAMTNLPGAVDVDTTTTTSSTEIFTVTGTDPDSTTPFYNMTCSPPNCPFQMLGSGKIVATENLDLHKVTGYNIDVWITDKWSLVGPETLSVTMTNINDKPVINNIPSGLVISCPENSATSKYLINADVTDNNHNVHKWTAVYSPADGANYFRVFGQYGIVTPKVNIDYEELLAKGYTSFAVTLTADDTRELSDPKTFTIEVTDVNEPQTGFSQTTYQITGVETTTVFDDLSPTLAASVIDPDDTRDTQTLTMDCGANTGQFSMDPSTGRVTKAAEYDLDVDQLTTQTIACVVTATDNADHTVTTNLNIVINEENDNPPVLNKDIYTHFLPINRAAGSQFGQCTSTDEDVLADNTETTYKLTGGSGLFGLTDACRIYNNVNFSTTTYKVGDSFPMTLTATNNNGLKDTATVNVILIDPVTTAAPAAATTTTTAAPDSSLAFPAFGGIGGSVSFFLDDPENLAWFIPAMLLLAVMLALLAYMIYRCLRTPGYCSRLGKLCKGRSLRCRWRSRSKRITKAKSPKFSKKAKKEKVKNNKGNKVRQLESNDCKNEWNIWSHCDFGNANVEHR